MTSSGLSLEDGSYSIPKQRPIVVQVEELPMISPATELPPQPSHQIARIVEEFHGDIFDGSQNWHEKGTMIRRSWWDPGSTKDPNETEQEQTHSKQSMGDGEAKQYIDSIQRHPNMKLPFFQDINRAAFPNRDVDLEGFSHGRPAGQGQGQGLDRFSSSSANPLIRSHSFVLSHTQSWPLSFQRGYSPPTYPSRISPLLTPPEDLNSFKWGAFSHSESSQDVRTVPDGQTPQSSNSRTQEESRISPTARPSEIQLPHASTVSSDDSGLDNWLGRACEHLVSVVNTSNTQGQLQMVVQALPSQAKNAASKPVFEKVVEVVQAQFTIPPYITITHAVSQVISMDEVPASPPATPNTSYPSDDYFQNQTIFTHAAVVPAYHSQTQSTTVLSQRPTNIIAAPSSIHISTLERYIPPSTSQEIQDFFTLSRRSYLSDRLLELSANQGTLLLVYPTKAGAQTFASKYIGPVIEPFLRQFVLLNELFTHVAADLGRLTSIDDMKTFAELQASVVGVCQALGHRAPARGLHTRYDVTYAETAGVVLERNVWKEWFLEQEQPRLRQNLVDYHKAGGRMPTRVGRIEVTPSMLAREVVEGIRASREAAGDVEIEVGVFVIRRSLV